MGSKRVYLEIEHKMKDFSAKIGIPLEDNGSSILVDADRIRL